MSEEFRPEANEVASEVTTRKEPELVQSPEVLAAIEAAKKSVSPEAKARRKQAAAEVASRLSREKDEVPAGFLRRSKDAKWYIVHTYSGHEDKAKKWSST